MISDKVEKSTKSPWLQNFEVIKTSIRVSASDSCDEDDDDDAICGCTSTNGKNICFDDRCINFATQTECVDCQPGCRNNRIQRGNTSNIEVRETPGKGYGLFACEDLPKGQFVIEYVGELITIRDLRARMNALGSKGHLYGMQLKPDTFLDASRKGSISRFINHSCEPNATVDFWTIGKRLHVGVFTAQNISSGTELTFDYKWEPSSNRPPTKCLCRSPSCRGTIEVLSQVIKEVNVNVNYESQLLE